MLMQKKIVIHKHIKIKYYNIVNMNYVFKNENKWEMTLFYS